MPKNPAQYPTTAPPLPLQWGSCIVSYVIGSNCLELSKRLSASIDTCQIHILSLDSPFPATSQFPSCPTKSRSSKTASLRSTDTSLLLTLLANPCSRNPSHLLPFGRRLAQLQTSFLHTQQEPFLCRLMTRKMLSAMQRISSPLQD